MNEYVYVWANGTYILYKGRTAIWESHFLHDLLQWAKDRGITPRRAENVHIAVYR